MDHLKDLNIEFGTRTAERFQVLQDFSTELVTSNLWVVLHPFWSSVGNPVSAIADVPECHRILDGPGGHKSNSFNVASGSEDSNLQIGMPLFGQK